MNDSIIDKLSKLINHERSARAIGSVAEADLFAAKIAELQGKAYGQKFQQVFLLDDGDDTRSLKQIIADFRSLKEEAQARTNANIQSHIAYCRSQAGIGSDDETEAL